MEYEYELLPTRLAKAAFLLWDSLLAAVQDEHDDHAVKDKLQEAFGQRHFLDCSRANLAACRVHQGDRKYVQQRSINCFMVASQGYGEVVYKGEKFRRFLAGVQQQWFSWTLMVVD